MNHKIRTISNYNYKKLSIDSINNSLINISVINTQFWNKLESAESSSRSFCSLRCFPQKIACNSTKNNPYSFKRSDWIWYWWCFQELGLEHLLKPSLNNQTYPRFPDENPFGVVRFAFTGSPCTFKCFFAAALRVVIRGLAHLRPFST